MQVMDPELSAGRAPWRPPRPRPDPCASGRKRARRRGERGCGTDPGGMERAGAGTSQGHTPRFLQTLQTQSGAEGARARVQEEDLRRWGLTGQWSRANFRPAGRLAGTRLSRAGTPRHQQCWAPRGDRLVGCFPAGAPAAGLGGKEPLLGPGGRCPARAARGLADAAGVGFPAPGAWRRGGGA